MKLEYDHVKSLQQPIIVESGSGETRGFDLSKPTNTLILDQWLEKAYSVTDALGQHFYYEELIPTTPDSSKREETSEDEVNHPPHYTQHPSGVECIQVTEHMGFNLGNAVKYIWRADLKHDDPTKDLRKAEWYIKRELLRLKDLNC